MIGPWIESFLRWEINEGKLTDEGRELLLRLETRLSELPLRTCDDL